MAALHLRFHDSISEFEGAARQRFAEAERLYARSHFLGAIYLYGYSVETRVKALYFRSAGGHSVRQQITKEDREGAAKVFTSLGLAGKLGSHDIQGWALLAVTARRTTSRPYPAGVGGLGFKITTNAADLYASWRETLRYSTVRPTGKEQRKVRRIARWFENEYATMI